MPPLQCFAGRLRLCCGPGMPGPYSASKLKREPADSRQTPFSCFICLEFLRFLLCKEGTKEAYSTHPLVRCCFACRAQRASPRGGEVAERQRWPVGLCPFPAARSLTGKLRAGHARPLRAMARCRVAAGAGGYGIRPYGGHRAKRQ